MIHIGMPYLNGPVDTRVPGRCHVLVIRDTFTLEYLACDDIPDGPDATVDARARELFTYFGERRVVAYHVNTSLLTVREILS